MCPDMNEMTDWERLEAYWATIMAIMGSLTVDPDPLITMTQGITGSDVEDDDGYYDLFQTGVEEGFVSFSGVLSGRSRIL